MTQIEKSNRIITAIVISLEIIIANLLFLAFRLIWLRFQAPIVNGSLVIMLLSLTVSYAISIYVTGVILYHRQARPDQITQKTLRQMFVFMLTWTLISSLLELHIPLNRPMILYFTTSTIIAIILKLICNYYLKLLRKRGRNRCNVVYVGSGSNLRELYSEMSKQLTTGYNICGYFDEEPNPKFENICQYLGRSSQIIEYLSRNKVDKIYCGLSSSRSEIIVPIINYCERHLIRFYSVPNLRNYCHRRVSLEMFSNVPLLTIREEPLTLSGNKLLKRLFDILFSLCFLCTAFPLIFIVVGTITKLTSRGPILFKQRRHGLDGREFNLYKFRSMRLNNQADTLQATEDDPRKTRWGDFLRRTSIDELPQFINVLIGSMSIVGPRPHMVKHTKEYSEFIKSYMVRHYIKPGITGWAQVSGFRGETKELSQMEGRIRADIWYMEHWTFYLDLYIIFKTAIDVIGRRDSKAF